MRELCKRHFRERLQRILPYPLPLSPPMTPATTVLVRPHGLVQLDFDTSFLRFGSVKEQLRYVVKSNTKKRKFILEPLGRGTVTVMSSGITSFNLTRARGLYYVYHTNYNVHPLRRQAESILPYSPLIILSDLIFYRLVQTKPVLSVYSPLRLAVGLFGLALH